MFKNNGHMDLFYLNLFCLQHSVPLNSNLCQASCSFCRKTSFNISCSDDPLKMMSLSFCLVEEVFIFPASLKGIFTRYRFWCNLIASSFLVSIEKCVGILMFVSLLVLCLLFFVCPQDFPFVFCFH